MNEMSKSKSRALAYIDIVVNGRQESTVLLLDDSEAGMFIISCDCLVYETGSSCVSPFFDRVTPKGHIPYSEEYPRGILVKGFIY